MKNKIVVTEFPDTGTWTINFNKYNDSEDIVIPKEVALEILRLQKIEERGLIHD